MGLLLSGLEALRPYGHFLLFISLSTPADKQTSSSSLFLNLTSLDSVFLSPGLIRPFIRLLCPVCAWQLS